MIDIKIYLQVEYSTYKYTYVYYTYIYYTYIKVYTPKYINIYFHTVANMSILLV